MAAADTTDVAIIGGGIMGSAVALRLAQRGVCGDGRRARHPGRRGVERGGRHPGAADGGGGARAAAGSRAGEPRAVPVAGGRAARGDRHRRRLRPLRRAGGGARRRGRGRAGRAARLAAAPQPERRLAVGRRGARARAGARPRDPRRAGVSRRRRRSTRASWRARSRRRRRRAGARFLTGRYVRRVVIERGAATGVELDGETLPAGTVVVAAGSWSGLVEGGGVPSTVVRPARGQLVSIETRPPLFRHVVSVRGGYLVPRRDGTVLAGSTVEMAGFRKQVTVGGLAGDPDAGAHAGAGAGRGAGDGDLVELPPLHGGPPAGAGRDAGARPGARDRPLPQRHPAGADHRRGDRRAGGDGAARRSISRRSRWRASLGSRTPLPNPLPAFAGRGDRIAGRGGSDPCTPSPACGRGPG